MVRLLGKALGKQQKEHTGDETVAAAPRPVYAGPRERILVLVPSEGGFAFRLLAFPYTDAASAYCAEHFPGQQDRLICFRALPNLPRNPDPRAPGPIEAVVLVRDPERHGTVHLYSFVDIDTAHAFVRAEGMRGLNLNLVLVFWAEPVALFESPMNGAQYQDELMDRPAAVLNEWQTGAPAPPPAQDLPLVSVTRSPTNGQPETPPENESPPEPAFPEPPAQDGSAFGRPTPAFQQEPRNQAPAAPPPPVYQEPAPPPQPEYVAPAPPPPPQPAYQAPPPQARTPAPAQTGYGAADTNAFASGMAQLDAYAPSQTPGKTEKQQAPPPPDGMGFFQRLRSWPGWDGMGPHMTQAMILRWQTYDDVRSDPYATGRAQLIVSIGIFCAAMTGFFTAGPIGFFVFAFFAGLGAAIYAGLIYCLATQLFPGRMERGDLALYLQRLGLAASPGFLVILGVIPIYGPMFVLAAFIWIAITSIKATEIAFELDRQSAFCTAIISALFFFAVAVVMPSVIT